MEIGSIASYVRKRKSLHSYSTLNHFTEYGWGAGVTSWNCEHLNARPFPRNLTSIGSYSRDYRLIIIELSQPIATIFENILLSFIVFSRALAFYTIQRGVEIVQILDKNRPKFRRNKGGGTKTVSDGCYPERVAECFYPELNGIDFFNMRLHTAMELFQEKNSRCSNFERRRFRVVIEIVWFHNSTLFSLVLY